MLPRSYSCTGCKEEFNFKFREACYYFGGDSLGGSVRDADLFNMPVRPAWCKDCGGICIAEDIAPLRAFEAAYGAARTGKPIEYPIASECMTPDTVIPEAEAFLRWRMQRRRSARILCCGGVNFQFLDVAQPLFRHVECDFGVIEPSASHIGPYNSPGPGEYSPADILVCDGEGELLGLLTWRQRDQRTWSVAPMQYAWIDEE